jgi:MFS family permease
MPLSEQEQRLLDEMERSLYHGDGDFVASVGRGRGGVNYTALVGGILLALAGIGILLLGVSLAALSLARSYPVAFVAFFGTGVGNGLIVVHERLIFHAAVKDRLLGRAFAILETLVGWGFAAAFLGGGAIIAALGARGMFAVAGGLGIAVWASAALALRGVWNGPAERVSAAPGEREAAGVASAD